MGKGHGDAGVTWLWWSPKSCTLGRGQSPDWE